MKFSVILTSYNRPNMVKQAINSVLTQSYQDFELIVVDDGSNPETLDTLLSFADQRMYVISRGRVYVEGCRYADAINEGLEFAQGDVITYLTDDDYYLPHRLELMALRFGNPDIHIVYGDQQVMWLDERGAVYRTLQRGTFGITTSPQCRIDHNSFAHKRSCLEGLEKPYWPTNDWKNGDIAFYNRLVPKYAFYPIESVLDVHRWHPNNIQSRMDRGEHPVYASEL